MNTFLLYWRLLVFSHLSSFWEFFWDPLSLACIVLIYSLLIPRPILILVVLGVILWKTSKAFYILPQRDQLKLHVHLFVIWIGAMASLKRWGMPESHLEFWSTTLLDTLTLGKDEGIRGSLWGALWYYLLLALYLFHSLHLYWSFTYRVQVVPEVKRYQNLPIPKMKK